MDSPRPKTTSAERMKKMRQKRKESDSEYQKQENRRISDLKKRKREKMSQKDKEVQKKYERDRKRLQRAKKKLAQSNNSQEVNVEISPYSSRATYSKAVWRIKRALPSSPRKQKAEITGLAKNVGINLERKMEQGLINSAPQKIDYSEVKEFFLRPDIVYTCPGMKDVVTVWENGIKQKLQKHYMTMFLKEAYYIFKESNPNFKIGFSKFCSLRPKNVLLVNETPAYQCLCKTHENFILKINALSPQHMYSNKFWTNVLCDNSLDSVCWKNECEKCKDGKQIMQPSEPGKKIILKQWEKIVKAE